VGEWGSFGVDASTHRRNDARKAAVNSMGRTKPSIRAIVREHRGPFLSSRSW